MEGVRSVLAARLPVILAVGWIALGLLAGALEGFAASGGTRVRVARGPVLAGVAWVPVALATVALARRMRRGRVRRVHLLLVHGAGALAASFVMNGLYMAAAVLLGWEPVAGAGGAALLNAVRWLHLNAGAYLAMVALVHATDTAPADDVAPAVDRPALAVDRGRGGLRIPLDEIRWLEADGDYVRVHTHRADHLVSRRMKELERELGPAGFVRAHRSAIVNVRAVREVRHRSHGDFEAVLVDGTVVRVSRTRREALLKAYREPEQEVAGPGAAARSPEGQAPSADVRELHLEDQDRPGGHEPVG